MALLNAKLYVKRNGEAAVPCNLYSTTEEVGGEYVTVTASNTKAYAKLGGTSDAFCTQGRVKKGTNTYAILSYSSHSEPNGLNRNKTVFSVTFQNIKNPKKPYKISIFDAKHQKYKQFVPSSIIGNQIPNLRRWRDVGGM